MGNRRESSRLADRVVRAMKKGTTQPFSSKGPVGRGGRLSSLRLVVLITPTVKARGHEDDEGSIKPRAVWEYADVTLNPIRLSGRVGLIVGRFSLKPYWGKPAVRNFREGAGNVG